MLVLKEAIIIKKTKETLKIINYFLSLFNLHIENNELSNLSRSLNNGDGIKILDIEGFTIGLLYIYDDEIYLYSFQNDSVMKSKMYSNVENDGITIKYNIRNKLSDKELNGIYHIYKLKGKEDYTIDNEMNICEFNEVLFRAKFNSVRNIFKLFDKTKDELVVYKNNDFFHRKINKGALSIKNDKSNINYTRTFKDKRDLVYGYSKIFYDRDSFDIVTDEFNLIISQIDEEYFDLVEKIKNEVNYFGDNLFEKSANQSIKDDKSVLDNILIIKNEENKKRLIKK